MPNKKYIISFLIAFVSISYSYSQNINNEYADYAKLDSITFADYTNKNWEGVIHYGNIAIENNIDYYYLRIRMGIAYFNLEKYLLAANNLQKALEFNKNDALAQLYLYDTYIILGKTSKAYKLSKYFAATTMDLLLQKRKVIEFVDIVGGYMFSNNNKNNKIFLDIKGDTLVGSSDFYGNKSVFNFAANINLTPSISMFASYTNLHVEKNTYTQHYEVPLKFDSVTNEIWGYQNYYSLDTLHYFNKYSKVVKQNEYYLNSRFQFNKGWAVTAFGNLIFINSPKFNPVVDTVTNNYINYQINDSEPVLFEYQYAKLHYTKTDTSYISFIAGVNIEKDFNNITLNLFATMSSLNNNKQNQIGGSCSYYFNSQASVYGNTGLLWFSQQQKQQRNTDNRFIITQKLGGKLLSNLWSEAEFTYGDLRNVNVNNGSVVYNQSDKTIFSTGINLRLLLTNHIEFNIYYKYIKYEGFFATNTEPTISKSSNTFNYQTQNILGGIRWKF